MSLKVLQCTDKRGLTEGACHLCHVGKSILHVKVRLLGGMAALGSPIVIHAF